jgi:hypothetical protein
VVIRGSRLAHCAPVTCQKINAPASLWHSFKSVMMAFFLPCTITGKTDSLTKLPAESQASYNFRQRACVRLCSTRTMQSWAHVCCTCAPRVSNGVPPMILLPLAK